MKVLTASLLASVLVVAAGNCSLAAETTSGGNGAASKIANVTHFDQLRSQQPIRLGKDWEVRLGIRDGGTEAGPWVLLYCFAKWTNQNDPATLAYKGELLGEPLGPVFYRVSMGRDEHVAARAQVIFPAKDTPPEDLYCAMVPTAWQGKYHVEVLSRDDKVIARQSIDVARPRPLYWHEFARQEGTILRSPVAARPRLVGTWPIWGCGERIASELLQQCPLPDIPMPNPWIDYISEPATAVRTDERIYPLKLSVENGDFVIQSPVKLVDWPDFYLLARWWVNDQPISPRRPEGISMREIGRRVSFTNEMRVRFGLPETLGQLEPGDKIGLQVLYSPAMIQQVPITAASHSCLHAAARHDSNAAFLPMTSNRVNFTVTKAMLVGR